MVGRGVEVGGGGRGRTIEDLRNDLHEPSHHAGLPIKEPLLILKHSRHQLRHLSAPRKDRSQEVPASGEGESVLGGEEGEG